MSSFNRIVLAGTFEKGLDFLEVASGAHPVCKFKLKGDFGHTTCYASGEKIVEKLMNAHKRSKWVTIFGRLSTPPAAARRRGRKKDTTSVEVIWIGSKNQLFFDGYIVSMPKESESQAGAKFWYWEMASGGTEAGEGKKELPPLLIWCVIVDDESRKRIEEKYRVGDYIVVMGRPELGKFEGRVGVYVDTVIDHYAAVLKERDIRAEKRRDIF